MERPLLEHVLSLAMSLRGKSKSKEEADNEVYGWGSTGAGEVPDVLSRSWYL